MLTAHAAIGNSDDRLSQADWSRYVDEFQRVMIRSAHIAHGQWYSSPTSPFQNACMAIEIEPSSIEELRTNLAKLRIKFNQDSIAMNVSETEFV